MIVLLFTPYHMNKILNNFFHTWKIKFDFFIIGAAYFPTGVQLSLSRCCTKAGVPSHCIGLCNPVRSVARSLGNRINACTEYDEDIEKCWDSYEKIREQRIPELDTNGEQLFQFYRLLYLLYHVIFYSLLNKLNLIWFVFHSVFIRRIWATSTREKSESCNKGAVSPRRASWTWWETSNGAMERNQ